MYLLQCFRTVFFWVVNVNLIIFCKGVALSWCSSGSSETHTKKQTHQKGKATPFAKKSGRRGLLAESRLGTRVAKTTFPPRRRPANSPLLLLLIQAFIGPQVCFADLAGRENEKTTQVGVWH